MTAGVLLSRRGVQRRPVAYSSLILATSGLMGYWRLGEATGTVAADAMGANNGTFVNAPTLGVPGLITGDADTAVSFAAASSQEVTLPNNVLSTNGTVEFWFKWTTGVTLVRSSSSSGAWIVGFDLSGTFAYRCGGVSTAYNTSKTTAQVRNGNRHHLALTKTDGQSNVFLDGVSIASNTTAPNTAMVEPWHVSRNGTFGQYSDATFDEIAIYSRALTAAEVAEHYAAGV